MPAGLILLLAFLAWPFLEIAAFIVIGREIGILPTLATVVGTSVLGAVLLKQQGMAALMAIRREMRHGELPPQAIGHAALIGLGGLLLLLPGFVSDIFGILLFLPPVRSLILAALARNATIVVVRGRRSGVGRTVVDLDPEEWHETTPPPPSRPDPSARPRITGPDDDARRP